MNVDLSKPHFTIILDERMGDTALFKEADNGDLFCFMHPSAAEDDSPARSSGHVVFRRAVEAALHAHQNTSGGDTH